MSFVLDRSDPDADTYLVSDERFSPAVSVFAAPHPLLGNAFALAHLARSFPGSGIVFVTSEVVEAKFLSLLWSDTWSMLRYGEEFGDAEIDGGLSLLDEESGTSMVVPNNLENVIGASVASNIRGLNLLVAKGWRDVIKAGGTVVNAVPFSSIVERLEALKLIEVVCGYDAATFWYSADDRVEQKRKAVYATMNHINRMY